MENLLYYPYINLPRTDWTARTLLYYDKIGSIVPQSYFYNPDSYEPFMKEMIRDELVVPINPLDVLDNPWTISRPFIDYLNSERFELNKRRRRFQNGEDWRIHKDKFSFNESRIHVDKFDNEIFYHLEQAGLAVKQDHQWYKVEKKTANELMSFLASVIGGKIKFQPTTDKLKKRYRGLQKKNDFENYKLENSKRELILKELIPFPEEIDLGKLRKFKETNIKSLKSFKNQIELIVLNQNIEVDSSLFKETLEELKIRKEELSIKMNESKLGRIIFGTVCGIVGALFELTTLGGLPGFANAIHSALQVERAEDIFDQSGMKYLALVDKRIRSKLKTSS